MVLSGQLLLLLLRHTLIASADTPAAAASPPPPPLSCCCSGAMLAAPKDCQVLYLAAPISPNSAAAAVVCRQQRLGDRSVSAAVFKMEGSCSRELLELQRRPAAAVAGPPDWLGRS